MPPLDPPSPTGPEPPKGFPTLPIVTPDPPRRPLAERYGALYYLGVSGLALLVFLTAWFAWNVWSLRSVWASVYVLHDPGRTEADRVRAAYDLSHDGRVNQRQLWDIALRTSLPPLARYVVAESLTAEAAEGDPAAYGKSVARSEGWPVWLRLLLTRPMGYAAALDLPVARGPLAELARNPDHATALWATYALAEGSEGDPQSAAALRAAASADGPDRELAGLLVRALDARRLGDRLDALDRATLWLRTHHPAAARLWQGWEVSGGHMVPAGGPAPKLH